MKESNFKVYKYVFGTNNVQHTLTGFAEVQSSFVPKFFIVILCLGVGPWDMMSNGEKIDIFPKGA